MPSRTLLFCSTVGPLVEVLELCIVIPGAGLSPLEDYLVGLF